ncbi:MAG: protein kinase [Myxococcota bacterium]|nr:protein kinase [Myxococcota bacterium]
MRQIAVGGMAEIHLAKTKGIAGFEKYVALKMIHPNFAEDEQFIQMLVDEAKIAVQLTHGNIAQTFDLGRVGETYYITMEYVDGADLYKILRRGSEQDIEMPLDVCAFIGKEVASALDHAHRKRDNFGKNLGIVHRDVSPQNVLVSYSGEVKLVDFGIAKATMKARQTAVGVIKGKYYYMSPEQALGEKIDYRSDIFSAGIVLYEMITGQMLYLEEDLHKLLDMARKADIAPPSKLRKGVPPQLERIVMHALAKQKEDRYQSAGDFATDLERFLHSYSPVFTAGKIAQLIKKVVGDPQSIPVEQDFPSIEFRDGLMSTHTLTDADLLRAGEEVRDENSVIFRVEDLQPGAKIQPSQPRPAPKAPKETRAADMVPLMAAAPAKPMKPAAPKIPSIVKPAVRQSKPRLANEETRQLASAAPPNPNTEDSGLLTPQGDRFDASSWDSGDTHDSVDEDILDNIGERTMISAPPRGGGFMMDVAGEDGVDATIVTSGPPQASEHDTDVGNDAAPEDDLHHDDDDEGPTLAREAFALPQRAAPRGKAQPPPPALAAKIHAPAVSALRKPRERRGTPPSGSPNVLQQIVNKQTSEPMPVPIARPHEPEMQQPPQFPSATPGMQPSYNNDASGLPLGLRTPPSGSPVVPQMQPPHMQPYMHQASQPYPQPAYPVSPGALYQFQPSGAPQPQPMTLTGQLRLFEADELPSHYKLGAARKRWFTYIVAGVIAISIAAAATFFIIRATRDGTPTTGSIMFESNPPGADIYFDNERLTEKTPYRLEGVTVGTSHDIRIELARYTAYIDTVNIPKTGREVPVLALLKQVTGKLRILSKPDGAEVWLDGRQVGRTPAKLEGLDMATAKRLELRLKDHQPHIQDLTWPATGQIDLDIKLQR